MSPTRSLILAVSLIALGLACTKKEAPQQPAVTIALLHVKADTAGMASIVVAQKDQVRRQMMGLLRDIVSAKANGDNEKLTRSDQILGWSISICGSSNGMADMQRRFSFCRSLDKSSSKRKLELDSTYGVLTNPDSKLLSAELVNHFRNMEQQYAAISDTFAAALSRYNLAKKLEECDQDDSAMCAFLSACGLASQVNDQGLVGQCLLRIAAIRSEHFGDYVTAERLSSEAIENLESVSARTDIPYAYLQKGQALLQLGQAEQARACYKKASDLFDEVGPLREKAYCEYIVAESYYNSEILDSALAAARRSTDLRRSLNSPSDLAYSISCEALIHQGGGDLATAQDSYREAGRLFLMASDSSALFMNMLRQSFLFLQIGRYSEAGHLLDTIAMFSQDTEQESGSDFEGHLFTRYGQALCNYRLGHLDSARGYLEKCLMQIDTSRTYASTPLMLVGFLSDKIDMYDLLTQIHIDRYSKSAAKADLDSVLLALERGKAQSLREMMRNPREEETGRPLGSLSRSATPCTMSFNTGLPASLGFNEESLNKSISKDPGSRDSFPPASQGLGGQQVAEISLSYCQKNLLGDNDVILEYCTGVFGCYVIMITKDEVSFKKLPVTSDSLDRLILDSQVRLRTRPSGESALGDFRTQSMALYDLLVPEEFRNSIAGHCLIIVPSGRLAAFPFAALIDDSGRFLCESCQVMYSPSLTVAAMIKNRQRAKPSQYRVVAVGSSTASSASWVKPSSHDIAGNDSTNAMVRASTTLPYASREIDSIISMFGQDCVTEFSGHLATKTTLRGIDYSGVRYLHVAAHGVTDEANPLHSAIMLSPVDGKDDGRLRPIDILQLRLATDMVFLSACGTGAGQVLAGEGVVSLARPFLVAGSNSVVATLWDIDDRSSAQLVGDFYRKLRSGKSAAFALAEAQRSMLQSDTELYHHPYFWAPFVVLGNNN
jgi:CHAT domain-containing protein/tetratricopeptide (TPR) repeat protein